MAIIQFRRGTAAEAASANPVLAAGEMGVELDTLAGPTPRFKIGDGTTAWNALPYATAIPDSIVTVMDPTIGAQPIWTGSKWGSVTQNFVRLPPSTISPLGPFGLAVDTNYIYISWANSIARANLDGSDLRPDFIAGASSPNGVCVNGSHIYWCNQAATTIGRANLDGSSINQNFITGLTQGPQCLAIDSNYLYWTNTTNGNLTRANLDGTGVNQAWVTGLAAVVGITVDGTYVYAGVQAGFIARANVDGSSLAATWLPIASGIEAMTADAEYIYWNAIFSPPVGVSRASKDGTQLWQFLVDTEAYYPEGIAVDAEHIYWANTLTGTVGRVDRFD